MRQPGARLEPAANNSTDLSICDWRGPGVRVQLVLDTAPRAQLRFYNQHSEQLEYYNQDRLRRPYQLKHVGDDKAYGGAGAWWTQEQEAADRLRRQPHPAGPRRRQAQRRARRAARLPAAQRAWRRRPHDDLVHAHVRRARDGVERSRRRCPPAGAPRRSARATWPSPAAPADWCCGPGARCRPSPGRQRSRARPRGAPPGAAPPRTRARRTWSCCRRRRRRSARRPATEDTLTMSPPPLPAISGSAAWVQINRPQRFTSIIWRHCAVSASPTGPSSISPALLTSACSPPCSACAASTNARACASSVMSTSCTEAGPSRLSASCSSRSLRRAASATVAPAAESAVAVAAPIPDEAPVTAATRPSSG